MFDKAKSWVVNYMCMRKYVDRTDFITYLYAKFKEQWVDIVKFNKIEPIWNYRIIETNFDDSLSLISLMLQENICLYQNNTFVKILYKIEPAVRLSVDA